MKKVLTLTRRELNAYFLSPMAYVVLTVFLVLSGIFFWRDIADPRGAEASMRFVFYPLGFILMLICPMITMRLLAEEVRSGTIEPLMTAPVTDFQVVLSKFLGATGFYICLLVPTVAYAGVLRYFSTPDWGPILSGYLGIVLLGCLLVSLGLFISSLTKNQIVAGIASFVSIFILWALGYFAQVAGEQLKPVLEYLGIFEHLDNFAMGNIDTKDIIYYLSLTVFFLFLTVRVVETRKWR